MAGRRPMTLSKSCHPPFADTFGTDRDASIELRRFDTWDCSSFLTHG